MSVYTTSGEAVGVFRTDGTQVWGGGSGPPPEPDPWPLPASGTEISLTTYDGSDSTCHPSVVDMLAETGDVWNGYRWWLADTPYVGGQDEAGSSIENPCVWGSNDRINWSEPSPGVNPLEPWPGGIYNSDTELVWDPDGQRLVMYWRRSNERIRAASSTDGSEWIAHGEVLVPPVAGLHVSPTVARVAAGDWRMWCLTESDVLRRYQAQSPVGPWTPMGDALLLSEDPLASWHGSVTSHKGVLIGVFDTRHGNAARPIVSTDGGATFTVGPVVPNLNGYRTTLVASTRAGYIDSWTGTLGISRPRYRLNPERVWLDLL